MGGACSSGEDGPGKADAQPAKERVKVGTVADFKVQRRMLVHTRSREIAVWRVGQRYYSLDNGCYHHGVGLLNGDIEDLGGKKCIVCPWHAYRITLEDGEGLYWGLSGPQLKQKTLKSKGKKQRAHRVIVDHDDVYVEVDNGEDGEFIESDTYARGSGVSVSGPIHSSITDGAGSDGGSDSGGGGCVAPRQQRARKPSRKASTALIRALSAQPGYRPCGPGPLPSEPTRCTLVGREAVSPRGNTVRLRYKLQREGWQAYYAEEGRDGGVPGQYILFRVDVGGGAVVERYLTVVARDADGCVDVIVRVKPDGAASGVLCAAELGSTIDVIEFGGVFGCFASPVPSADPRGLLLLSAGVGITPMLAMLKGLADNSTAATSSASMPALFDTHAPPTAPVTFVYGDRTLADLICLDEIVAHAARLPSAFVHIFLSQCDDISAAPRHPGVRYHRGRVAPETLQEALGEGFAPCHAYLCGPEGFYSSVSAALMETYNFPPRYLHTESFDA